MTRGLSVEVGDAAKKGETRPRRHFAAAKELVTAPSDDVHTVYDLLQSSVRRFTDKKAVGWRDIVRMHEEKKEITKTVKGKETKETKTWKYFELSDPKWWSYSELAAEVSAVGNGLAALGLNKDTVFNIYSATKCVNLSSVVRD